MGDYSPSFAPLYIHHKGLLGEEVPLPKRFRYNQYTRIRPLSFLQVMMNKMVDNFLKTHLNALIVVKYILDFF